MSTVLTEDDGPVRVVTLNRPEQRNAIDMELRVELANVLEHAMFDDEVRAVVLAGAGTAFCAGGDLVSMRRQHPAETRPRAEAAARVVRVLWTGPTPVVAAVEGPAMGAGLALALACDRIVASSTATFGAAFSGVGLAGDMGVFASLPARVGPAAAKQMLLFAERFDGSAAHERGLVDRVVEPGEALASAVADAHRLAIGPPLAYASVKRLLNAWPRDPHRVLDDEVDLQCALFDTDDFAEGVAAFHDKRRPAFTGRRS